MIAVDLFQEKQETDQVNSDIDTGLKYKMKILKGLEKKWIEQRVKLHLFVLAFKTYKSVNTSVKVLKELERFKKLIVGGASTKIVKVDTKYYYNLYAPAYPSKIFNEYIKGEFNRIVPVKQKVDALIFTFFAITKKCPLRCEHCFEWDNLNKRESLNLYQLKTVLKKFQKEGLSQFHLSGGEPLARMKDLTELIYTANKQSEFYVLTSGFNFTSSNAKILKQAGLTGVVISLDHFDAEKHNAFRGFTDSFEQVKSAIANAQQQNLVVALTICITKDFINLDNLMHYVEFAKKQKVVFVQLLEPKAVGHYKDKDVSLTKKEIELLEDFYKILNFNPKYEDYPIIIYHGYHQRRIGCLLGGNRGLYIDSEGYINACPFCHTKNLNIKDVLHQEQGFRKVIKTSNCPAYNNNLTNVILEE